MAYDPHPWQNGEALTAAALNRIELGIKEALDKNNYEELKNKVQEITKIEDEKTAAKLYPTANAVYNLFHSIPNASDFTYPNNKEV